MALVIKNIGYGVETTWGTAVTPTTYPRIKNFNINVDMGHKLVEDTSNTQKGWADAVNIKTKVEGEITFNTYPDDIGWWLRTVLGTPANALHSTETVVYDHTFAQGNATPSVTLVADKGVEIEQFAGVYGNTLKLSGANDLIEGSLNIMAKSRATGSAYTPTATQIDPFSFDMMNMAFGSTISAAKTAEGSSPVPLDEWSMTFSVDLSERWQSGSKTVSRIDQQIHKLSGDFKQFYNASTYENLYFGGTFQAMYFDIKNTNVTIGNSANYEMTLSVPKAHFKKDERPYEAGKLIVETTDWEAIYSSSDSYMFQALVTNLLTTY